MADDKLVLRLRNGLATIKTFMLSANITYNKDVSLKGMSGPKTTIKRIEVDGAGFRSTMLAINPSPLEIDLGTVKHEIRNSIGTKIAEQKGKVYLNRGESIYIMTGVTAGAVTEGDAVIVGLGVDEENVWAGKAIEHFKALVTLPQEFVVLCNAGQEKGNESWS